MLLFISSGLIRVTMVEAALTPQNFSEFINSMEFCHANQN
jgi:hypothetical protein